MLLEWSNIIEKMSNEYFNTSPRIDSIRFRGTVKDNGKFALDVKAPGPEAMVCLLRAIQDNLILMPTITREFFVAIMISLSSDEGGRDSDE